jgi:hypothetical protein
MKTPAKNQKKQGSGDTPGSKASSLDKNKHTNSGKGPWKNPDPTNPKKSPEKVNEPYAGTNASVEGKATKSKPATGIRKEKITNAGESEHHIPVNKSDYENFEEEYEDFEFDEEEEEDDYDYDEDGETDSTYSYEDEEDETRFFRSQVKPENLKKQTEQNKLNQKNVTSHLENKHKSPLSNQRKNINPQG